MNAAQEMIEPVEAYGLTQIAEKEIGLDNRAANGMEGRMLEIHKRLERHAKWCREGKSGWPASTLLGRLIEEGEGIHSRGKPSNNIPPDVAVTDAALAKLGAIDRKVIRIYYDHYESADILAKMARMRKREFQNVLRRARWRLSLHIDEVEGIVDHA
jgi:hypothetical protein